MTRQFYGFLRTTMQCSDITTEMVKHQIYFFVF